MRTVTEGRSDTSVRHVTAPQTAVTGYIDVPGRVVRE